MCPDDLNEAMVGDDEDADKLNITSTQYWRVKLPRSTLKERYKTQVKQKSFWNI